VPEGKGKWRRGREKSSPPRLSKGGKKGACTTCTMKGGKKSAAKKSKERKRIIGTSNKVKKKVVDNFGKGKSTLKWEKEHHPKRKSLPFKGGKGKRGIFSLVITSKRGGKGQIRPAQRKDTTHFPFWGKKEEITSIKKRGKKKAFHAKQWEKKSQHQKREGEEKKIFVWEKKKRSQSLFRERGGLVIKGLGKGEKNCGLLVRGGDFSLHKRGGKGGGGSEGILSHAIGKKGERGPENGN